MVTGMAAAVFAHPPSHLSLSNSMHVRNENVTFAIAQVGRA